MGGVKINLIIYYPPRSLLLFLPIILSTLPLLLSLIFALSSLSSLSSVSQFDCCVRGPSSLRQTSWCIVMVSTPSPPPPLPPAFAVVVTLRPCNRHHRCCRHRSFCLCDLCVLGGGERIVDVVAIVAIVDRRSSSSVVIVNPLPSLPSPPQERHPARPPAPNNCHHRMLIVIYCNF